MYWYAYTADAVSRQVATSMVGVNKASDLVYAYTAHKYHDVRFLLKVTDYIKFAQRMVRLHNRVHVPANDHPPSS